jgi:lysophospholipase L1-like esterase
MSLRKHSEIFFTTTLVVTSCFIPIILVELFATFVLDYHSSRNHIPFFKIDSITGWAKIPNMEETWYLYNDGTKARVRNNSHGFTDRDREIAKSKPRIALIGDSTTEFWEAEEEARGQTLMERKLNHAWEVLNFGVRGFSTDQAYLLLKHKGMKFSPDIVIYTFCINDLFGNTQVNKPHFELISGQKEKLILKDFPYPYTELDTEEDSSSYLEWIDEIIFDRSFLYRKVSRLLANHPMGVYYEHMPLEAQTELRPYKKIYNAEEKYWWELFKELILEIKQFSDRQGVRFLLVEGVYGNTLDPERMAWSEEKYGDVFDPEKVTRLLKEFSEQEGISFLSIQDEVRRKKIPITDLMHPQDYVHLNAAGIKLYSDWVLEKLKTLEWL